MDITIGVICHNEERNIRSCMESLADQMNPTGKLELVIVDNGSTDGTLQIIDELATQCRSPVRVVPNPKPGIGVSRNCVLREARYPMVLFIDADCSAPDDWVESYCRHAEAFLNNPKICAMGAGNVAPPHGNSFQKSLEVMLDSFLGSHGSPQGKLFSRLTEIPHHPCMNLLVKKALVLKAGGFNEDEFNFMGEDIELSLRMNRKGYRYLFLPENAVFHQLRPTLAAWAHNMFAYGQGRSKVIQAFPESNRIYFTAARIFAPVLIVSVLAAIALWYVSKTWALIALLPWVYLPVIALASLRLAIRKRRVALAGHVFVDYVVTHFFYSLGMWF